MKISTATLISIIEQSKKVKRKRKKIEVNPYKLIELNLLGTHTASMCLEHQYEIVFENIDTNEMFITEYTFDYGVDNYDCWNDYISDFLDDWGEEDVEIYQAEIIYVPKYQKKK
jgi:hypothetical protein